MNDQILALHRLPQRFNTHDLVKRLYRMLWFAVLFSDKPLIVPTVDIIQSPVAPHLMKIFSAMSERGLVEYVGSTGDVEDLINRKLVHFSGTGLHKEWEQLDIPALLKPVAPYLLARTQDTSHDMLRRWAVDVAELEYQRRPRREVHSYGVDQLTQAHYLLGNGFRYTKFIDVAASLPERLGGHAFLWSVVQSVNAFRFPTIRPSTSAFERALAYYWVLSHVEEYDVKIIGRDWRIGSIDCGLRRRHRSQVVDLISFSAFLDTLGLGVLLDPGTLSEMIRLRFSQDTAAAVYGVLWPWFTAYESGPTTRAKMIADTSWLREYALDTVARCPTAAEARRDLVRILADHTITRHPPTAVQNIKRSLSVSTDRRLARVNTPTIFIGHGRSLLWIQLRDLIRDRLGLGWEEFNKRPVAGRAIVERIEEMLSLSSFAFLVLTGEDETRDGTLRARQNVIHELGLFQGRLGFERAVVLLEDGCEDFSNLAGLQQIRFPKSNIMAAAEDVRRVLEDRLIIR